MRRSCAARSSWHGRAGARRRRTQWSATIYVTLEPCAHTGKTPPCTDALVAARVARAVIAVRDPNPAAAGGVERLRDAGIEVAIGVEDGAARELNAPFFHSFVEQRPWITLKLAVSLDGALADATGHSRWVTGEDSRRLVHEMRAGSDAIGVGIGTALADDPSLTVRDAPAPRVPPLRVVFDRAARLPLDSVIVRTAHQVPPRRPPPAWPRWRRPACASFRQRHSAWRSTPSARWACVRCS